MTGKSELERACSGRVYDAKMRLRVFAALEQSAELHPLLEELVGNPERPPPSPASASIDWDEVAERVLARKHDARTPLRPAAREHVATVDADAVRRRQRRARAGAGAVVVVAAAGRGAIRWPAHQSVDHAGIPGQRSGHGLSQHGRVCAVPVGVFRRVALHGRAAHSARGRRHRYGGRYRDALLLPVRPGGHSPQRMDGAPAAARALLRAALARPGTRRHSAAAARRVQRHVYPVPYRLAQCPVALADGVSRHVPGILCPDRATHPCRRVVIGTAAESTCEGGGGVGSVS
eukprot:ctg_754.g448